MRTGGLALVLAFMLAGCECGPGRSCRVDTDCGEHAQCLVGYCVFGDAGAALDGGSDELDGGADAGLDAGTPHASLSMTDVDFGLVGCGRPPVTQTIELTNSGDGPLTFSSLVTNALFSVTPHFGAVDAGATLTLSLSARVPSTSVPDIGQAGLLTLFTNDPRQPQLVASLALVSSGVQLALQPSLVSFGVLPVGTTSSDVPLTVWNYGNVDATVSLTDPSDSQFTLLNTKTSFVVPAQGAWSMGSVRFSPTRTTPSMATATLTVAEPRCAGSMSSLPMNGQGSMGGVGLSTTDLFFGTNGAVACGTQAAPLTLTLSNDGTQPFSWSSSLERRGSSPFTVSPTSGTLAAKASVGLTITPSLVPATADTRAEGFSDVLTLVTTAPDDTPHAVQLHQSARGAVLRFGTSSIAFGAVPLSTTASTPLSIINSGSAPAQVTLSSSNVLFSTTPSALKADVGTVSVTSSFAPTDTQLQQGSLSLNVGANDALCAPLPSPLAISGTGSSGIVSYSPLALDFGLVPCGAAAQPAVITFTNPGTADYTLTTRLGLGDASPYTVTLTPANGRVAAQGTATVTVTPHPIPMPSAVTPNLYGDVLSVTTNVSGDVRHDIELKETAQGAIFALVSPALSFGTVAVGESQASTFTVTNSGNLAGGVSVTMPTLPTIFSVATSLTVAPGSSASGAAAFTPAAPTLFNDMVSIAPAADTIVCRPMTSTLSLSGTGIVVNALSVVPDNLSFGLVDCGRQAEPKELIITNSSSSPITLTYTFDKPNLFVVKGGNTVPANQTLTISVAPEPIPSTASVSTDAFGATLTISAPGETLSVAMHQTAQGAILSFQPSALSLSAPSGGSDSKSANVVNSGNVAASASLGIKGEQGSGVFSIETKFRGVGPGESNEFKVGFSCSFIDVDLASAQVEFISSSTMCAPVPELPLTGSCY